MVSQSSAASRKVDPKSLSNELGAWSLGHGPLYAQLADALAGEMASGVLRAHDRLPSERQLASELGVSRGTAVKAYEQLVALGKVERRQGSGTTVIGHRLASPEGETEFVGNALWVPANESVSLLKAIPQITPEVIEAIAATDILEHGADLNTAEPLGWWSLRERIALHHSERGLPTTPQQIMVTSGAQQAIALAIQAVVAPGDIVLGEEFTWPGLIDAIQHQGGQFKPVRLNEHGVDIIDLERQIERFHPVMVALNPQHHNPSGARLPVESVEAVARLCKKHHVFVIEDRVAADIAFDRRRLPAIADFDTGGHCITVDSVSKVAWPGLRIGWMRADPQIINRVRPYKTVADMFASLLSQAVALEVLDRYEVIVDARVTQLRARAELVAQVLTSELPEWTFIKPRGGLCVWVTLPSGVSAEAFAQHGNKVGVQVGTARQFGTGGGDLPHLRVPFTAPDEELAEGLRRLVAAWRSFDRAAAPSQLNVI